MKETVLIAGGTGLIGKRLSDLLSEQGYRVLHLSRRANLNVRYPAYFWNPSTGEIDAKGVQQADYIVQLAGAGIADARWTDARKRLIIESRTQSNLLIANALRQYPNQVKGYIAASAIGFYGDRVADELLDEQCGHGQGFLAQSTRAWENAIEQVTQNEANEPIRGVTIRVGIVLSLEGGALPKMLLPFKYGVGNVFGNGEQVMSWIHIDDICNIFIKAIQDKSMKGIYNGVAPLPVSNCVFVHSLGKVRQKWCLYMHVPAWTLRLALGEMADVVLTGCNVSSQKIENQGFVFQYRDIESALSSLLKE